MQKFTLNPVNTVGLFRLNRLLTNVKLTVLQFFAAGLLFTNAVFSQTTSCATATVITAVNAASCTPATAFNISGTGSGPTYSTCATSATSINNWGQFVANSSTASISYDPQSSRDAMIFAYSGTCPGSLTQIGCIDASGNGVIETLNLTGLTAGSIYFVRIVAYNRTSGGMNGDICVASPYSIKTGSITGSPFCAGAAVSVPFVSYGTYTGNTYTAQLSNSSGSFASPVNIGTLVSNANSGAISATIPPGTGSGTDYRIRVICSSPSVTGADNGTNITVNGLPTITSSATAAAKCFSASAQNSSLSYSATANTPTNYTITWNAAAITAGLVNVASTALPATPITVPVAAGVVAGTYTGTITVTNANGCSSTGNSFTLTINAIPTVTITPNYCIGGGVVRLTCSAQSSYLWSTGAVTQYIDVITAGNYSVTGTSAGGCTANASIGVAQELVTNGNFSAGNTGFTTLYGYTTASNGLYPEGLYAVGNNANYYHGYFFGNDHTTGSGNFMIVNGSAATQEIWEQMVTVTPNTTYYFSAWATSLNDAAPYAQLRFAVNNVEVGTTAVLPAGANSTGGPFTWYRFYGTWNSGSNTSATINIVDLQTAAGGNDFGLDDISFSTLSPVTMTVAPVTNTPVCAGTALNLTANVTGGGSPFTYSWTGPGSYTSSTQNPVISSAASSNAGVYSLTVTDGFGCTASGTTASAVINPLPTITTSAAASARCVSVSAQTSTLNYSATTNTPTTYTINWNAAALAAGLVNVASTALPASQVTFPIAAGIPAGTYTGTITVTNANGCTSTGNSFTLVISSYPVMTSAASASVCTGSTVNIPLTSDISSTYTWVAAINANVTGESTTNQSTSTLNNTLTLSVSSSQVVTYTVTPASAAGGCAGTPQTVLVTVNPLPTVTGTLTVCAGSTIQLTGSATAAASMPWVSATTSVATVSNTGLVTGVAAGTSVITYTNTNGCTITATVNVNARPTITGTLSVCAGSTTQLTGSATAAASTPWVSATTSVATVNSTGLVTGVAAGTSVITYTNTNGCTITATVTVNARPTITGTLSVCAGSATQLTGSATAAASTPWVSATPSVATVSSTGLVTGVAAGTSIITYTNSNGCTITATVTVNARPTITGTLNVCAGSTTQLTGSATAAASTPWVSATTSVATVSSTGLVTGVAAGTSVITYTNTNGCTITATVTVNARPTITGTLIVCAGSATQLTGSATAAASTPWISATTSVATVSNTGLVTGVAAGTSIITYTNSNGCTITATVTVNARPTITGTLNVCAGSTTQLTGSATAAASTPWVSATTSVATVSSTGLVTGVAAGTSVITYTNTNGCTITATVTVNARPTITGTLIVCAGSATQLTGSATAAASTPWISATTSVATVSNTGLVTGVAAGTSIITYTNSNGCTITATVTVNARPTITGTLNVCAGSTTQLTGSATAAASTPWVSATTSVATVNSTGLVTGVAAGTSVITYTNTNGCTITATVTVNARPTITGSLNVCAGSATQLTGSATAAASTPWVSATASVATVSNTGLVTGIAAGTSVITYTNTNGCNITATVTVNARPTITGTLIVCAGSATQLTGSATAAASTPWISSTNSVATVSNTGFVTGVAAGTSVITYTNANGCNITATVTVNALPTDIIPAAASATICSGNATTIQVAGSQSGVNYQLRNNATNTAIGSAVPGTGGAISLPTGTLASTTVFNVLASNAVSGCNIQMSSTVTVTVNPGGQWIGGTSGDWNVAGNWCGGIPSSSTNVIIPAGSTVTIQSGNALANSITIAASGGLVMTGAYNLTITAGGTFTNNGSFTASGSTGTVAFSGSGTISGTTTFKNIDTYGALDFGTASTVSGTFSLQSGGSVTGHSPFYTCPSAVLLYKPGSIFSRGLEWTTSSSGAGYPSNVIVQNNTTINFPAVGNGYVCYDLQIDAGSSLKQNYGGGSASLSVGRNITINGTLDLGASAGGNISLGGNWIRNTGGVFNANDRVVTFDGPSNFSGNGVSMSTISAPASVAKDNEGGFGGENFAHLWVNKTNATDSVVLLSNITVTRELGFTKGTFSLRNSDVTMVSNSTRTADIAPVTTPANISVRYGGTGRFVIQRYIQNPTAVRSWRLLTAPLQSATAPSINQAYMEGVVNPNRSTPNSNGGIYNPWPGYGTHITGPGGAYSATNGFDQGTNSSSILYGSPGLLSMTWLSPSSTIATKVTDQQGWMLFVRGDRGFAIGNQYTPAQNTTLEPKGKINIGDVTVPVTTGRQVIGNPYASSISLMNVDVSGILGKLSVYHLWDPKMFTSYTQPGKWVSFTGLGSLFVHTTSASSYLSNGTVESGQAFLLDVLTPGNITFHESDKIALTSSLTGIANRPADEPVFPMFRSDIYAKSNDTYVLTDGVLNVFAYDFNNAADDNDAKKFISFNTKESLSILRDSVKIAIEKRNDIQHTDTIFFSMSKFNEIPYRFRFEATDFYPGYQAFLEDSYLGNATEISTGGVSEVDFNITADPLSKAENRFRIVFKRSFNTVLPVTFTSINAYRKNKDIKVEWKVDNETNISRYEVERSADGLHFTKKKTETNVTSNNSRRAYEWTDEQPQYGINYYRVKSIDINGRENYSRIAKVFFGKETAAITVFPNPVEDGKINLYFTAQEAGDYTAKLYNTSGQLVQSAIIQQAAGSAGAVMVLDNNIVHGNYILRVIKPDNTTASIKIVY